MTKKIYILYWGNGMVGIFDEKFDQINNGTEKALNSDLQYVKRLYGCEKFDITYLHSHEELNMYRRMHGYQEKGELSTSWTQGL